VEPDPTLDDLKVNWRHQRMFGTLEECAWAASEPLSSSERAEGWTDEVLSWIRQWFDRCRDSLSLSPHPPALLAGSWGRWLTDVPGRAFDPGSRDPRKEAVLVVGNRIHAVRQFEDLYLRGKRLRKDLAGPPPEDEIANGWSADVRDGIGNQLERLMVVLRSGRALDDDDVESWYDSLTPYGALWADRYGYSWDDPAGHTPGFTLDDEGPSWKARARHAHQRVDRGPRFWKDQRGVLWERLGHIARLFDAVKCTDQFER